MSLSFLVDSQVIVQPGQYSNEGILADLYLQSYHQAHEKLSQLPGLLARHEISQSTYKSTDACLCALVDSYAYFLGVLGFPQPPRPR